MCCLSAWNILPKISAWLISLLPVVVVQSLSGVWLFVTRETAACQASLSFTMGLGNLFSSWFWFSGEMGGGLLSVGSDSKESACNAEDPGSVPGLGRFPEEENVNPLQYSSLENSTERGAWWATVHGVAKSWTRMSDWIELNFHLTSSSHSISSQTSLILSIQCFLNILHFHSFSGHSLYLLSQILQLQANYLVI